MMRVLFITDTPQCRRDGDDFYIWELVFECLLGYVANSFYTFVTTKTVPAVKAIALANAIKDIDRDEEWEIGLGFLVTTEQEVHVFCTWLKEGEFMIA